MYAPCLNPSCSKQGQSHPNCRCYDRTSNDTLDREGLERPGHSMAEGGEVSNCKGSHKEDCQYHLPENPHDTFHGALVQHGLSGLLKSTSTNLSDNPFKPTDNFIRSSRKGSKKYSSDISNAINGSPSPNDGDPDRLQEQLDEYKLNPDKAYDIGSGLAQGFGDHATHMASVVGRAGLYLDGIKPQGTSMGSLGEPTEPSEMAKHKYNRQLKIVEQPMHVLKHIKSGSVLPEDVHTLQRVYPNFYNKIKGDLGNQIIDAKSKGKQFSSNEKASLGTLTGEQYDVTMSPDISRAAMVANTPKAKPAGKPGPGRPKQTEASISQQEKVNQMFETPTQSAAANKKE
jgi:hypothetical protein